MQTKALVLLSSLVLTGAAFAQTKAPEPDYTLSYNVGAVTDYRYRGISQTRLKPALQGGIDFAHKSGFYVGTWASTIRWIKDDAVVFGLNPGATTVGNANLEVDLYGGYKWTAGPLGFDVGALQYWYPRNKYQNVAGSTNADTTEVYGAVSFSVVTAKYSHVVSSGTFGIPNSRNSYYVDLSAAFDLGNGFSVVPHIGYQGIKNAPGLSYTDYSVTLAKDFGNGFSASAALVDTDTNAYVTPTGRNRGKAGVVLGAKYSF